MTEGICSVEGCTRVRDAGRRFCYHHWVQKARLTGPFCIEEGCDNPSESRKLCSTHYQRWKAGRPPTRYRFRPSDHCAIPGCERPYYARGYCTLHRRRQLQNGDPLRLRVAAKGTGSINSSGYRVIGKKLEHRTIMESMLGRSLLPEETVHHRNGDKLDNRRENLELWSRQQPPGQRVADRIAFALEVLDLYCPEALSSAATQLRLHF